MAYNVKITEYANGQLEVITYKQGVYTMLDGESSYRADMIDKNVDALAWRFASYVVDEKTGQGRFIPRIEDREYCYNPFTEKIQCVYTDADEWAIERKKEHSLYSSLNRTRSSLYMYARQCNWNYACVGANRLKMAAIIRKSCVLRIDTSLPLYIPY